MRKINYLKIGAGSEPPQHSMTLLSLDVLIFQESRSDDVIRIAKNCKIAFLDTERSANLDLELNEDVA